MLFEGGSPEQVGYTFGFGRMEEAEVCEGSRYSTGFVCPSGKSDGYSPVSEMVQAYRHDSLWQVEGQVVSRANASPYDTVRWRSVPWVA